MAVQPLAAVLDSVQGLTLFSGVLDAPVGQAMLDLLSALDDGAAPPAVAARAYATVFRLLADDDPRAGVTGLDAWRAWLVAFVIDAVNPWSRRVEQGARVTPSLRSQAQRDLRALRRLYDLDGPSLLHLLHQKIDAAMPVLVDAWSPWDELHPMDEVDEDDAFLILARRFSVVDDWAELAAHLETHWSRVGTGPLARSRALRWQGPHGGLVGVERPDPVLLSDLLIAERPYRLLTTNTERFLAGLPAHDALLYGAPGTGKSSTVKALANTYAARGLRLVDVRKEQLHDLPAVVDALRRRAPRFLLFVDDLSFEEGEDSYKALKVVLEGAAESRPPNVLIYATTNRLNVIRENVADRGTPSEDVHGQDTMNEKIALGARFGLRVTFSAPTQDEYCAIALRLARRRGLNLTDEEIRGRALRWERSHPGRSGRLARQFVDDLQGELGKPS